MSGCCVYPAGGEPCGEPGQRYWLSCVHEHGSEREICNRHAVVMPGVVECVLCEKGREPHVCPVTMVLLP